MFADFFKCSKKVDTDVNVTTTSINDYYFTYPYVFCIEDRNHIIYDWGRDPEREGNAPYIRKWLDDNCKDKARLDVHRAVRLIDNYWVMNEFSGTDFYFVAFRDIQDYQWFMLRWL